MHYLKKEKVLALDGAFKEMAPAGGITQQQPVTYTHPCLNGRLRFIKIEIDGNNCVDATRH